jgi:hypothetical protein
MYSIEAEDKRRPWISGIFKRRTAAERYFARIPAGLRRRQSLVEVPFSTYPFFIIEKCGSEKDGFQYLDAKGVRSAINALEVVGDKDAERIIIFFITKDFCSPEAGADDMGALDHEHITNRELSRRRRAYILRRVRKTARESLKEAVV